jgi:hypothetical protein
MERRTASASGRTGKVAESAERVADEAIDANPIHDKMADTEVRSRTAHSLSAGDLNAGAAGRVANVIETWEPREELTASPCHNIRRCRHHTRETYTESQVRDRTEPRPCYHTPERQQLDDTALAPLSSAVHEV